jgi:hypothetical protein
MEQQPFFADVDLPFHVWVREGRRWVLRDAATRVQREGSPSAKDAERRAGDPPAAR